jgi:hypothetical protein
MLPLGIIGRPLVSKGAQDGFIMFKLMVYELLNIEQFFLENSINSKPKNLGSWYY